MAVINLTDLKTPTEQGKKVSNAKLLAWDATDNTLSAVTVSEVEADAKAATLEAVAACETATAACKAATPTGFAFDETTGALSAVYE